MGFLVDHPHTAITETVYRVVTMDEYELESNLPSLVRMIKDASSDYQYTLNQEELARAIRKKLKYGSKLQQVRSLDLLNMLISQGIKFSTVYNDDKLIERLDVVTTAKVMNKRDGQGKPYSSRVVKNCNKYLISWNDYILDNGLDRSRCYRSILDLSEKVRTNYSNNISSKKTSKNKSTSRRGFLNDRADESMNYYKKPKTADQLYRIPPIDLKKESPKISLTLSNALAAAIALENSLITLPAGKNAMDDEEVTEKFVKARDIRRKVLRYLQLVTEGEFLGSLIHANDKLVEALTKFDERSWEEGTDGVRDDDDDDEGYDDDSINNYETDDSDDMDESRNTVSSSAPRRNIETDIYANTTKGSSSNPFGDQNEI
ncbi:hypothetical protein KAFR_0D00370 [Kazachstania africana CBS 2517]|uniref:VHS domain-containing protein n=1 Tax=Kazachstania africana (strain ATCC 22294 / BCRC 22015 / CBS 2517 / CECT 1963 / NBRC 1671 / NRRL Y-8276) TaxID=1071382 RepID=H2ATI4_KAZAF|nr:hypothetical protein KAFR_0D00370 [Kazachstania africana CBS 2517]CCF57684.1 hypothetical protein KAFR_0D00370 [Kazachstania africana CBS 2517]